MQDIDVKTFQNGIFKLRTRRFGTVAELLVQKLLSANKSRTIFHDLFDEANDHRIEVKFSTVNRVCDLTITPDTLLDCISTASEDRSVPYAEWERYRFGCNIQQIKRTEFDFLYYGLFFSDQIVIFRIPADQILTTKEISKYGGVNIGYSDKQHKGNIGEGQFFITNKTLPLHLEHYLYRSITYEQFLDIMKD